MFPVVSVVVIHHRPVLRHSVEHGWCPCMECGRSTTVLPLPCAMQRFGVFCCMRRRRSRTPSDHPNGVRSCSVLRLLEQAALPCASRLVVLVAPGGDHARGAIAASFCLGGSGCPACWNVQITPAPAAWFFHVWLQRRNLCFQRYQPVQRRKHLTLHRARGKQFFFTQCKIAPFL